MRSLRIDYALGSMVWVRHATLILISFSLAACASPSVHQIKPSADLPSKSQLEVPFFAQADYQCAPSALSSIYHYRDITLEPKQLVEHIYLPERKGSLQMEIVAHARSQGLLPYPIDHNLKDLMKEIAAGNPVLVLQNLGFKWWPQWHYAVALGYDIDKQLIILHSGKTPYYTVPLTTFDRTWSRAQHWGLVLMPVGQFPATAKPLQTLSTIHQWELVGKYELAESAYQRMFDRWPDFSMAKLALANLAVSMKSYNLAIKHYQAFLQREPRHSVAWNNLAYALGKINCNNEALKAVQQALVLEPDKSQYIDTRTQLMANPSNNPAVSCQQLLISPTIKH